MPDLKIECPACLSEQWVTVGPWQTAPGVFGALSLLCHSCDGLSIVELRNSYRINIKE